MKTSVLVLVALLAGTACNKTPAPKVSSGPDISKPDTVVQKLQEFAGTSATDCGRLDTHATAEQTKAASDCVLEANQGKKPFYVDYDMPGMAVGVAGNSDGKLFTVQTQGGALTSGDCPSQLRVAASGRITCFAPGDMGSMSGSHAAGTMPSGMQNPHGDAAENPHSGGSTPQ